MEIDHETKESIYNFVNSLAQVTHTEIEGYLSEISGDNQFLDSIAGNSKCEAGPGRALFLRKSWQSIDRLFGVICPEPRSKTKCGGRNRSCQRNVVLTFCVHWILIIKGNYFPLMYRGTPSPRTGRLTSAMMI